MSRSTFSGPVLSGTVRYNTYKNIGNSVVSQTQTITQNSTNAVSATFYLPALSQIADITMDTTVAWNSATSAILTVGLTAGATDYVTSVDVKAASPNRATYTFTAAQLTAMLSAAQNTTDTTAAGQPTSRLVATVTPTGATSAGTTVITVRYAQFDDRSAATAV